MLRGAGLLRLLHHLLQQAEPQLERVREALLLDLRHAPHELQVRRQLGVGALHRLDDDVDALVEERLGEPEHLAVAGGAAHDPAQHVAAPLVGGQHAVADQEGGRPQVVGDDAHRDVVLRVGAVALAARRGDEPEQRREQVGVVVALLPLDDGGQALEAHARVDARLGQRRQRAGRVAVELHEDQVPDLQVAVAVAADGALRPPAADRRPLVDQDLAAGAAGAGVPHLPEVVLLAEPDDAPGRQAGDLRPERRGLVVVAEDGDPEAVLGQAHGLRQELPGVGDRVGLEVVAEGEVAEHLEEGVVARGAPDVLQVVVLAAGADALLRGRGAGVGAPVLAEEDVLELDHPGVGEQQRRVLGRHERRGADHLVPVRREVVQEFRSDLVAFHASSLRQPPSA